MFFLIICLKFNHELIDKMDDKVIKRFLLLSILEFN